MRGDNFPPLLSEEVIQMRSTKQPRWIRTRFRTACMHCRQQINKHDDVLYYPDIKKVSCVDCNNDHYDRFTFDQSQETAYFENVALSLGGNY